MTQPKTRSYEAMGTIWNISVWDPLDDKEFDDLMSAIIDASRAFDDTFSRFKKTSLITALSKASGVVDVPEDFVRMLRLYEDLYDLSDGKCTPLIGGALSDLGYDAEYSLTPKKHIRPVQNLHAVVRIIDDTHMELTEPALFDLGALGKGYMVDTITDLLNKRGLAHFLVDGSGDVRHVTRDEPIRAGMEDPKDPTKVIGVVTLGTGSLCASGGNRRAWKGNHHIIDPDLLASPDAILATWVLADSATLADALATCLFLSDPSCFLQKWNFEYCIMNRERKLKRSAGFTAELF